MTTSASVYPLTWPQGFKRSTTHSKSAFKASLPAALANVQKSLKLFAADSGKKIDGIVISSNVSLGVQQPPDPGVAVWFSWDGIQVCIPVDRYQKVEENLQAIHHIIEARRTELRHGGLEIVRATFTGFKALPAPGGASSLGWREVLSVPHDVTRADAHVAYTRLRSKYHPDKPTGDREKFELVNRAWEQADRELPK